MKNIHLLPTDKPSTLSIIDSELVFSKEYFINPQHIYITSDEEIKENDYYLSWEDYYNPPRYVVYVKSSGVNGDGKKIILTTDQDLINDGVQAIDDEFLEWFVKNPSCESVEVEKRYSDFTVDPFVGYKIIIPQNKTACSCVDGIIICPGCDGEKESEFGVCAGCEGVGMVGCGKCGGKEPKQETMKKSKKNNIISSWLEEHGDPEIYKQVERKLGEITLEKAAENYANKKGDIPTTELEDAIFKQGFIDGAKWQSERMYSEEELKYAIEVSVAKALGVMSFTINEESFEEFKKKN